MHDAEPSCWEALNRTIPPARSLRFLQRCKATGGRRLVLTPAKYARLSPSLVADFSARLRCVRLRGVFRRRRRRILFARATCWPLLLFRSSASFFADVYVPSSFFLPFSPLWQHRRKERPGFISFPQNRCSMARALLHIVRWLSSMPAWPPLQGGRARGFSWALQGWGWEEQHRTLKSSPRLLSFLLLSAEDVSLCSNEAGLQELQTALGFTFAGLRTCLPLPPPAATKALLAATGAFFLPLPPLRMQPLPSGDLPALPPALHPLPSVPVP